MNFVSLLSSRGIELFILLTIQSNNRLNYLSLTPPPLPSIYLYIALANPSLPTTASPGFRATLKGVFGKK